MITSKFGSVFGGGSGSSLPGSVDYAYIVAKAKVGLDAAIAEPTSWALRATMPSASADISTDTQLSGCVYMRTGGVLVAEYSDGTDACTYTVAGGWLADDALIIVLYTDGVTIQIGIVTAGAYSWGTIEALVDPASIAGFSGETIDLSMPGQWPDKTLWSDWALWSD